MPLQFGAILCQQGATLGMVASHVGPQKAVQVKLRPPRNRLTCIPQTPKKLNWVDVKELEFPRPPNVPLLRAFWSLLDGMRGVLIAGGAWYHI